MTTPCLGEFFVDTEMREPAGAATAQYQTKGPAGDSARQSGNPLVVAGMMRHRLQQIPPTGVRFGRGDQVNRPLGIGPPERFGGMGLIYQDDQSIALSDNISLPEIAPSRDRLPPKPSHCCVRPDREFR